MAGFLFMRRDTAEAVVLDRVRRTVLTPEAIDFTVNEAIRLLAGRRNQPADLRR